MHFPSSTPLHSPFAVPSPASGPGTASTAPKRLIDILAADKQPIAVSRALNAKHIRIDRSWLVKMDLAGRFVYHGSRLASMLDVFMDGPARAFNWNAETGELTLSFTHEGDRDQASCQCGPDGEVTRIRFEKADGREAPFELCKPDAEPSRPASPPRVVGSAQFLAAQEARLARDKRPVSPRAEMPGPHRRRTDEAEGTSPGDLASLEALSLSEEGGSQEARMTWEQAAPALREALEVADLGVAREENQACLAESYAHHTEGGTQALSGDAIRELGQTRKLLQGLESEGWDIRAWGEACRAKDAPLANPPRTMLERLGVTREDAARALVQVRGGDKLEGVTAAGRMSHFMPELPENIGLFRDPGFLGAWRVPGSLTRDAFFQLLEWLEKREPPLSDQEEPIRSFREWAAVDGEAWRDRLETYLSSQYKTSSRTRPRSTLNQLRAAIYKPPEPDDEARARQALVEKGDRKIDGLSELTTPAHRDLLIAFYRELTAKPGLARADGALRDDEPGWGTLDQTTKGALGFARNLLRSLEKAGKTYGQFIEEKNVGDLTGEDLYKALRSTLNERVPSSPTNYKPFVVSAAVRAAMHAQATATASASASGS